MPKVICSSVTLRKEEPSIVNSIGAFEGRNHQKKKQQIKKKEVHFHPDNALCHKSMATLNKLYFEFLLQPPYSPDLAPATAGCLQTSKNASRKEIYLQWRSNIGNLGVFWSQRQIVLQKSIEFLEKHWNQCISSKETMLINKVEFCQKIVLLVRPGTYWVMC